MEDNKEITIFGETNYRNQRRKFGIMQDDRRRHAYIVGKTGMGKSTMIENMVIDDIRKGNGLAIVDPHGDLAEKIIKFIPPERTNDVIYFNPADIENPVAFNILENINPDYKHLIAYGLVGVFKKIWADSWGPRMEYILTNTILALIEYPGATLLGLMRMLVDKTYRKKVVSKVTDPVVKTFWTDEFSNYSEKFRTEAIAPIQNKVGQFIASSIIRNIVGQSKSSFDPREIMDEGKILIMNLSKGRVGEENSALLGAMMITKIQLAAMSRVDVPEEERRDFYLYVDEFQNFATEAFANILSEARKYRLSLVLAHQYIEQLSDEVRAAVFGNVGTMIAFRVGANDAEELEKEMAPAFTAQNLVNIEKYNFFLKLMINGVSSSPFSAIGLPPATGGVGNDEKIIRVSRERFAKPRAIVEDRILRWSGVEMQTSSKAKDNDDVPPKDKLQAKETAKPAQAISKAQPQPQREIKEISDLPVSLGQAQPRSKAQPKQKKQAPTPKQIQKMEEKEEIKKEVKSTPKETSLENIFDQTTYFGKAQPQAQPKAEVQPQPQQERKPAASNKGINFVRPLKEKIKSQPQPAKQQEPQATKEPPKNQTRSKPTPQSKPQPQKPMPRPQPQPQSRQPKQAAKPQPQKSSQNKNKTKVSLQDML
ncbi:type IV secretion system DNA-binding domain-containing protein [Patescibacteria group bacterium]|nr:type IV secretion system DNA-binding domain-containing protein [Patescibacteria group bacterium]MBU1673708.1 type IV secretion system DNA-binding domain-containing protein [Patescibacteria group bacterium]MBU1963062.1 type IV secretion system DNA-binding domain-containing protein [Patescibacteria group bacterium]